MVMNAIDPNKRQYVCVLHNSKTIKPSNLKLCMYMKKTPRKCKSENWVFGLIKTPLLKITRRLGINAEWMYLLQNPWT